jgi:plastocyanin
MRGRDVTRAPRAQRPQRGPVGALRCYLLAVVSFVSFALILPPMKLAAARPGSIRGRVELKRPAAPIERRPGVADLGTPAGRDVPNLLRSVVYLESAPRGAFETSEGGRAVMDQRNETFVPHVLAITTGTTVDFPNSDKFYHNVFSLSKTRPFDLGRYAAGNSRPVRFDRAGIIRVFCDIHSHMNAYILVFNHPFFAMTDVEGRYRIENVPPGTYGVIAWNEGTSSEARPITVPDGGVAELDFTLR